MGPAVQVVQAGPGWWESAYQAALQMITCVVRKGIWCPAWRVVSLPACDEDSVRAVAVSVEGMDAFQRLAQAKASEAGRVQDDQKHRVWNLC